MIFDIEYKSGRKETLYPKGAVKSNALETDIRRMVENGQVVKYEKFSDQETRKKEKLRIGLTLSPSGYKSLRDNAQAAGVSMAQQVRNTLGDTA